jgi:hypothetical protein
MKYKLTDIPVIYINLDEQTERKEQIENSLKELGFKNIIRLLYLNDIRSVKQSI